MRYGALLVLIVLSLLGCRGESKNAGPPPFDVGVGGFKHVSAPDGPGTTLTFSLSVRNSTKTKQSGYLFIYAIHRAPMPPTRGVWPWPAVGQLNNSRMDLIVTKPKQGYPLNLAPGAEVEESCEIQAPPGRNKFSEYGVVIVDEKGKTLMTRQGGIR